MGPDQIADPRAARGRLGEEAALSVYRRRGFRGVARNWRCALGEIDLVLERAGVLVFCEVETRTGDAFGAGYEAVTWSKRRRLRRLAEVFLASGVPSPRQMRFDLASVWLAPGVPEVEIFEDAF